MPWQPARKSPLPHIRLISQSITAIFAQFSRQATRRGFIAKFNRNSIEKRSEHFGRRKVAAQFKDENISGIPFLHFESPIDMEFMRGFFKILHCTGQIEDMALETLPEFVFTHTKHKAIQEHRDAIQNKMTISTLVDMDADHKNKKIRDIDSIHSTRYACTLLTIQFMEGGKGINIDYLSKVIRMVSEFKPSQCDDIRERAIERTWERLLRSNKYAKDNFEDKKLHTPLNDHSLAEAIAIEQYGVEEPSERDVRKVEKILQQTAIKDQNGMLQKLMRKMLQDLLLS